MPVDVAVGGGAELLRRELFGSHGPSTLFAMSCPSRQKASNTFNSPPYFRGFNLSHKANSRRMAPNGKIQGESRLQIRSELQGTAGLAALWLRIFSTRRGKWGLIQSPAAEGTTCHATIRSEYALLSVKVQNCIKCNFPRVPQEPSASWVFQPKQMSIVHNPRPVGAWQSKILTPERAWK